MGKIDNNSTKDEILNAYQESYGEVIELKEQLNDLKKVNLSDKETILRLESEAENAIKQRDALHNAEISLKNEITVVIPYIKEFAQGNELQLALRGWAEFFKNDFNIVIIGSREDWMNDEVDGLDIIECKRKGNNPPIDIAHKMLLAIESDLVTDKFIWANDDQYLISPCILSDFEILKSDGLIKGPFPNNLYGRNKEATLELLKKASGPTWDYSTHTPLVYEKERLKNLIEKFKLTKNAKLISSLYFNWYFPEFVPLRLNAGDASDNIKVGVYRQDANFGKLKQLIPQKKLVNNSQSGWSEPFAKIMNKTLSEKCRFEK